MGHFHDFLVIWVLQWCPLASKMGSFEIPWASFGDFGEAWAAHGLHFGTPGHYFDGVKALCDTPKDILGYRYTFSSS